MDERTGTVIIDGKIIDLKKASVEELDKSLKSLKSQEENLYDQIEENLDNDNDKIVDLLQQLLTIQTSIIELICLIFTKEGQQFVEEKYKNTENILMHQAKLYGQKPEKVKEKYKTDLKKYKDALKSINDVFEGRLKNIIVEMNKYQINVYKSIIAQSSLVIDRKKIMDSPEYEQFKKQEEKLIIQIDKYIDSEKQDKAETKMQELKELREKSPIYKCGRGINELKKRRQKLYDLSGKFDKEILNCRQERNVLNPII